MGVWYSWSLDIPGEKESEARTIVAKLGLEKVIKVNRFSGNSTLTLNIVDEAISQHDASQAGEALKELANLLPGTDLDGQTLAIRYEGEQADVWLIDGKVLYLELLSVEKAQKGIEVLVEAREEGGPETRYIGILAEEGT